MARFLIQQAHGGQVYEINDTALPYFPGYVVLDTLDDFTDDSPLYITKAASDFRYAKTADLLEGTGPAAAALRAASRTAAGEAAADPTSTLRTALAPVIAPPAPRMDFLGDSITAMNGGPPGPGMVSNVSRFESRGFIVWGLLLSLWRIGYGLNFGVSGQRTDQMAARLTDVIGSTNRIVHVLAGTNDIVQGRTAAAIIADLTTIYDGVLNAGKRLLVGTVPPNSSMSGDATRTATLHQVNRFIRQYAGARGGVVLIDYHSVIADPGTGLPAAGLVIDGTHPTQDGAALMGKALAEAIVSAFPARPPAGSDNSDTAAITNGRMVGSSSGVATGWTLSGTSGTFTAVGSKVPRTDAIPGEAQQVKIGPGNTGSGQLFYQQLNLAGFAVGELVRLVVIVECDADLVMQSSPPAGARPLGAYLQLKAGGTNTGSAHALGTASGSDGIGTYWPTSAVLKTGFATVAAGDDRFLAVLTMTGVDTGTLRVKHVYLEGTAA